MATKEAHKMRHVVLNLRDAIHGSMDEGGDSRREMDYYSMIQ